MLDALAQATNGKDGGDDRVTVEMSKNTPIQMKMHLMKKLMDYILTGAGERPDSWRVLLLQALPKISGARELGDYRMIALSSTRCKWVLKILVTSLPKEKRTTSIGRSEAVSST